MPKEVKKRAHIASGGPYTSKEPHSVEDDVKALRKLFEQSTPRAVINAITDSFETAAPEHLRGLREILSPLFKSASTPLHCVRCHKTYVQSGNHKNACVIECVDGADYIREWYNGEDGYYKKDCCETIFTEVEGHDDICLPDWHTTDPMDVSYCEGTVEDSEEGLDVEGSRLIMTCRLKGCEPVDE
ncbi:hypothetical protein BDV93DRAFT_547500 [Ceratobasidium sp. AG-I]|nr:hypothetical protein BDV93DRAFT_547500 [Ceratobasidium sp. AG-I]